jgi:polar amino acid transport system substrate-binding protein
MLFDAVTSALDPQLTGEVLRAMEDLARGGMTMILVTHEMALARKVASNVVYMHEGKVWETLPGHELEHAKTPELRAFGSRLWPTHKNSSKGNKIMQRRSILTIAGASILAMPTLRLAHADTMDNIKARKKLLIALDLGSPPYGMVDAQMQPTGSDVETARLLANDLGFPLEIVQVTSPNRVPFLLTGKADMVLASFSVTEERKQVIDFSDPYGVIQSIVAAKKTMELKDEAGLAGKRIGTTRGSTNDKEITSRNTGAQIVRYDDDATLTTALVSGQVDIMATSLGIMAAANASSAQKPFELKFVLRTFPYAIGLRKNDTALRTVLNEWIHTNLRNGKLNDIYKKYNGAGLPAEMLS